MAGKTKKVPEEHPFYHDTWKLLKNYRDVAWNLELARQDLEQNTVLMIEVMF